MAAIVDPSASNASAEAAHDEIPWAIKEAAANPIAMGAAAANVIMQLSLLPVGHGVSKSRVDSGRVDKRPVKRGRTTVTYLVVALLGNSEERRYLRDEVNRSHRDVYSLPNDAVTYNAFDKNLQLWVAACLWQGVLLSYSMMHGEPDEATADAMYRYCSRLGTTLQVPEEMWPADRRAFDEYWRSMLPMMQMDDVTRSYLWDLASLSMLGRPVSAVLGPLHRQVTAGFLPEPFRSELGLSWGEGRQRIFDSFIFLAGRAARLVPRPVRAMPWTLCLWDFRFRMTRGIPFV